MHGHNYIITVVCEAAELNSQGMVVDFAHISDVVKVYDHTNLNAAPELLPLPTAEVLAEEIASRIPHCVSVCVRETSGSEACYVKSQ